MPFLQILYALFFIGTSPHCEGKGICKIESISEEIKRTDCQRCIKSTLENINNTLEAYHYQRYTR